MSDDGVIRSSRVSRPRVVTATAVLLERDQRGVLFVQAYPGTIGVVVDDSDAEWPVVRWFGDRRVYDVPFDAVETYCGHVNWPASSEEEASLAEHPPLTVVDDPELTDP